MECLDRFNKKMRRCGGTLRDEFVFNSKMLLRDTFHDDPSLLSGIYLWELGKLNKDDYSNAIQLPVRLYKRTFSAANGYTVKFQTEYDTPIIVGDILFDTAHNEFYLCTESFDIDSIHYQGKLTLCNWILKWQDKEGRILEYPCYDINSTQYNSGETENKQFAIGTAQHMISLPCDDNTVILDTPKRFFLDKNMENPSVYIVTQNDTTSYNIGSKGIVRITVMQYPFDEKRDNIKLGICDYMDIDNDGDIPSGQAMRSSIGYDTCIIKSGGDPQLFVGKFFDGDGNEVSDIAPKWTMICDFKDELEVEESGCQMMISIDDERYIDEEIKLVFSDEFGNYPSTVIIKIDSLL